MTFRALAVAPSWQKGEGSTVGRRETASVAGRIREDKRRRRRGEGEGAHYVSVISRIRRVFSICSKAPLVRAASCLRCVGAVAPLPPKKSSRGGRENREKRCSQGRKRAVGGDGRGVIRAKKKNRARARVQSTRASHESSPTRVGARQRREEGEEIKARARTFCLAEG